MRQIAGSSLRAYAQVLGTTALSLVYSSAENHTPVRPNSTNVRE